MLTQEHIVQTGNDTSGDGGAGNGDACFPHRDGFIPQLLGEILPLLRDIDTDSDNCAVDGTAFGIAGELGENTADLAAVENDIIGPLDGGRQPLPLQHLTDRKPCAAGKQAERGGVAIGAEEIGKIDAPAALRKEAASQSAVAVGLAIRQHDSAGGCAFQGKLKSSGIGGVGLLVANNRLSPALRQVLLQQLLRHAIGQGGKAVAQSCDGFESVALLPQAAGCFPNSCAGNTQPDAQFFAGVIMSPILPQFSQQFCCQISFGHDKVLPICRRNVKFPLNPDFWGIPCRQTVEKPQGKVIKSV